ncbi:MAG TPA: sigma 54-interacting transcriptional regulator, partial [Permianibacter sp.]|nr:sigma 54-interacting transcriptional regulator [Permianibacter sp.]
MSEQRLALVGTELEARLLADCKPLVGKVLCYHSWSDCLAALPDALPDVVVGILPAELAVDRLLIQRMQQQRQLAVIVLAADEQLARALHLFQQGAFEYLPSDCDNTSLLTVVQQALRRYRASAAVPALIPERAGALIGESAAVHELQRSLQQLSKVRVPVLIRGEPGSGKRLFAQLLHDNSQLSGPLVMVNVSAMDRNAIDVELFGLERVVSGDTQVVHAGKVEQANGGTLFLDEIADLPLDGQIRLAQLLADGHYHRVGGYGVCTASVRVVAATRHSLEALVRNGQFQPDLY